MVITLTFAVSTDPFSLQYSVLGKKVASLEAPAVFGELALKNRQPRAASIKSSRQNFGNTWNVGLKDFEGLLRHIQYVE